MQRQILLAAGYQHSCGQKQQQPPLKAQNNSNNLTRQNAPGMQFQKRQTYSTEAGSICPACNDHHTYRDRMIGEAKASTQFLNCADVYMMKTATERGARLEKLKGCRLCTSWKHTATDMACCMNKFWVLDGTSMCKKKRHTILHASRSAYCQAMWVKAAVSKRMR